MTPVDPDFLYVTTHEFKGNIARIVRELGAPDCPYAGAIVTQYRTPVAVVYSLAALERAQNADPESGPDSGETL